MTGNSQSSNNIFNNCSVETNSSTCKSCVTLCRKFTVTKPGSFSAFGAGCMTNNAQLNNNSATDCTLVSGSRYQTGNLWAGARLEQANTHYNNAINCTDERPELIKTTPTTTVPTSTKDITTVPTPRSESLLLSPLLAAGATTIIGAGLGAAVSYSYYKAYKQGKTGRDLALHPLKAIQGELAKLYKYCTKTKNIQDEIIPLLKKQEINL